LFYDAEALGADGVGALKRKSKRRGDAAAVEDRDAATWKRNTVSSKTT
jgi:hypothetical protein